jgi:hypothetical protein
MVELLRKEQLAEGMGVVAWIKKWLSTDYADYTARPQPQPNESVKHDPRKYAK